MRTLRAWLSLAVAGALAAGSALADDGAVRHDRAPLRVVNSTDFAIEGLYLSAMATGEWGANLLTGALGPGEELELDVACGRYDALIVDEDGLACELVRVDLCRGEPRWAIRDTCDQFEAKREAHRRGSRVVRPAH
jgi:hypothetical protein